MAKLSFRNLRKDNNFADVTLACEDGQQVEAHTAILAGQVLANQLYHRYYNINTTNINTDDININDRSTFSDEGPKQLNQVMGHPTQHINTNYEISGTPNLGTITGEPKLAYL